MDKPTREQFETDELFHEALIEYGQMLPKIKKFRPLMFEIQEEIYKKFEERRIEYGMNKKFLLNFIIWLYCKQKDYNLENTYNASKAQFDKYGLKR